MIFETQLFLGFPLTESYRIKLEEVPLSLSSLFIQKQESSYLQEIENEGMRYLGKQIGSSIDISSLDLAEAHIYSLLKKLVPDYSYEHQPLLLLVLFSHE